MNFFSYFVIVIAARIMYAVIEFEHSMDIEVIPSSWLQKEDKQCLWPRHLQGASCKLAKAIQNRLEPDTSWDCFDIRRVMYRTGNYFYYMWQILILFIFLCTFEMLEIMWYNVISIAVWILVHRKPRVSL